MRKVIQHESKTYLAPMPVVEKPWIGNYIKGDMVLHGKWNIDNEKYERLKSKWQECTGFEIGQEVEEGDWEMRYIATNKKHRKRVAIPKQQPEREEERQDKKAGCGICGSGMVYIRGKYPKQEKRLICPCCAFERLEQINEISSLNYGKTYTEISPLTTRTKE